jgi:hypothetical protein
VAQLGSDIVTSYVEGIYRQQRYLANWYPSAPIQLGDKGILAGALWVREGSVPTGLLSAGSRLGGRIPVLEWGNTREFVVQTKAAGEVSPVFTSLAQADAGISYTFHHGGGILFSATELVIREISETFAVRKWMLDEYREGRISHDTLVVTKLLRAETCVILMSQSDDARIEMRVSASTGLPAVKFAALHAHATITSAVGMHEHIIITGGAIPLFGGLKLKRTFLRQAHVRDALLYTPSSSQGTPAALADSYSDDDPFEEVGPSISA